MTTVFNDTLLIESPETGEMVSVEATIEITEEQDTNDTPGCYECQLLRFKCNDTAITQEQVEQEVQNNFDDGKYD